ncbi:two pore domain potassium channel family protein [Roseivirga sp. E12]|uniref:two pore domain potassium channel family protein n=1 Tax=Roseivirga sp. E12 TaxID=2819237 RepID=UPI001ABC5883|nr:two pore domain potassium channel family protein [Roseivirga sp. E12]MBO3697817.1 two pore domain potassium channel family protein [Roseivirga sp. E12]
MNKAGTYERLYKNRFELFFGSLITILFGSLVVPIDFYERVLSPVLFLLNLITSTLLISHRKGLVKFFVFLFTISLISFGLNFFNKPVQFGFVEYIRLIVYFLFYIVVTIEIIKQVWKAKEVSKNVIMGLMSGYISIGLLGFFLFLSIEILNPGAFNGLLMEGSADAGAKVDSLIYYSYITLLTIGYGEIYPVTAVAQKAAILVGLMGQFYLVIITAVVVEKYIRFSQKKR